MTVSTFKVPHLPYGYMVPKSKKSTDICYATLRYMPKCAAVVDLSFIASKLRFPVQTTPPVNWVSDPILTNGKRKPHTLQRTLRNQQLFACSPARQSGQSAILGGCSSLLRLASPQARLIAQAAHLLAWRHLPSLLVPANRIDRRQIRAGTVSRLDCPGSRLCPLPLCVSSMVALTVALVVVSLPGGRDEIRHASKRRATNQDTPISHNRSYCHSCRALGNRWNWRRNCLTRYAWLKQRENQQEPL